MYSWLFPSNAPSDHPRGTPFPPPEEDKSEEDEGRYSCLTTNVLGKLSKYFYDSVENKDYFKNISDPAEIRLYKDKEEEFSFFLVVCNEAGNQIVSVPLTREMVVSFYKSDHSMNWTIATEGSLHTLKFTFSDAENQENEFKQLFAICLFETSRRADFMKTIKSAVDQDWFHNANESSPEVIDLSAFEDLELEEKALVKLKETEPTVKNSKLAMGMTNDRAFVVRGNKIDVFRHTNDYDDDIEYSANINVRTANGSAFAPSSAILHKSDHQMMLLNPEEKDKVYALDLESEKIVNEFRGREGLNIRDLGNVSRYAQKTAGDTVIGVSNNAVFQMDPRVSSKDKYVFGMSYKKNPYLSCVTSTSEGNVAVASKNGDVRLFSSIDKRAKTLFPGLGNAVIGLDTTNDGSWILATSRRYILVIPTSVDGEKTGFHKSMGKNTRPAPMKLQLKHEDMARYGIRDVNFTQAHFDIGGEGVEEKWIVSSCGEFVITWSFDKVKKGIVDSYKIKQCGEKVVADQFRYGRKDEVVVATYNDVVLQKRKKHLPSRM